jgi:hypothetical protein
VLKLVSLPVWHSLSPGRLQLELAAQPALAKRWKTLLKKEAKAAKTAAAAAAKGATDAGAGAAAAGELPKAEASFLPGMLQEVLQGLRTADALLTGTYQQQQQEEAAALAAAVAAAEESSSDEEEEQQQQQDGGDGAAAAAAGEEEEDAAPGEAAEDAAADAAVTANGHANGAAAPAASSGQPQRGRGRGRKRGRGRGRGRSGSRGGRGGGSGGSGGPRLGKRLLLHLERFVEFLIDLLSQLPTRRFVHSLVEDQQLLVKVRANGCTCTFQWLREVWVELLSQPYCREQPLLLSPLSCARQPMHTRTHFHSPYLSSLCLLPFPPSLFIIAAATQARRSALYSSPQGHLFQQLLDLLAFYCDFPMDDHTGEQLKEDDVTARHYDKVRV